MAEKKKNLPWGLDSASMKPSSMSKITNKKLKAFSTGSMNTAQKKTPFQLKKEAEERKKKEDEQLAAKAFAEFKEYYDESPGEVKSFVRGDVIPGDKNRHLDGTRRGGGKLWKPDDAMRRHTGLHSEPFSEYGSAPKPLASGSGSKPRKGAKKKSQMEMFKEKIKRDQEERDARRALKGAAAAARDNDYDAMFPPAVRDSSKGSFDTGDPNTTNLYVGNLSPEMNEAELCRIFGKFGPLASVKIMWPRTQEEKVRGRLCGFVAFMNRKDGDACLEALTGQSFFGYEIRLGWGKAVPLPPRPFYVHAATNAGRKIKTGLPFNAQPKPVAAGQQGVVLSNSIESATIVVVIPAERALRHLIHRTIEFVIRYGPEFEDMLIRRTSEDRKYQFLTDATTHEHTYYRWKLFSLLQGDRPDRWSEEPFKMFVGGSSWEPPDLDQLKATEEVEKGHLSTSSRDALEDLLHKITLERRDVAEAMVFCLQHADASLEIIDCIAESLGILETPVMTKVARLFLVSDILYNCSAPVRNASSYRHGFESKLPQIFMGLHETYKCFTGRLRAEQFRQYVTNSLAAWKDWNVFAPEFFERLENLFKYGSSDKPEQQPVVSTAPKGPPTRGWKAVGAAQDKKSNDNDDDVDGVPLDNDNDVDGVPLDDDDEDLDGEPLDDGPTSGSSAFTLSKWERDDEDEDDREVKRTRIN